MSPSRRAPAGLQERVLQGLALALFGVLAAAVAWILFTRLHPSRSQALGLNLALPAPAFSLADQDGRPFASAQLAGKVWVADFIYTRCAASCPTLSAQLAALQKSLQGVPGVAFVSITVDPRHDRPAVLKRYARDFGADLSNWSFLCGDPDATVALIRGGFKLPVQELQAPEPGGRVVDIPHSSSLALVDRHGLIRAYYEGIEQASWPKLEAGVRALLEER
jgi:cytochrome oxidase Cu insertion factor (SCO1/SenC/PrrC family)